MDGTLSLLLFICLLQGVLCDEFMVSLPQTVRALRGSCVTVPCYFDIESRYENNLKNDKCTAKWINSENQKVQLTATGDLTKKNCTTTFHNLQRPHNDTYTFRLECGRLSYHFKEGVRIEVTDAPPSPALTPPTLNVKKGAPVSLTCSAPAPCLDRPPTLTWTPTLGRIQGTLQENQDQTKVQTSVLSFTASHRHHRQKITCTAVYKKQDGSSVSVTKHLTAEIFYLPTKPEVSARPSGPVQENSNVLLTCSGNANPAVKTYTWYRADGGWEILMGTGRTLNIEVFSYKRVFFCKVENNLGAGRSDLIHIDVQYSPKETSVSASPSGPVQENSNVLLTCSGNANPPVKTYTWYRADGGRGIFMGTGSTLNINVYSYKRVFFCKAENDLGAGESDLIHIDVQYSPQETSVSASPSGPVVENSNVSLTCSGNANPAVETYTWYKTDGGQETYIGPGRVLNITASVVNSVFFCKAENDLGVGRSNNHEIDVQFPPQILPSSDCTKTSTQINCSCETVGNPSPAVLWHLDGRPVNQDKKAVAVYETPKDTNLRSIITVNQPQDTDLSTTLLCFSSNSVGSASKLLCADCLQASVESPDQIPLSVFIITVFVFLVLLCVLLFVIRFKKAHHRSKGLRGEKKAVPSLIEEANEAPNTIEDGLYASVEELRKADRTLPATVSETEKTSAENGEDVVYITVDWTKQGKKKKNGERNLCGSSYQDEEKSGAQGLGRNLMSNTLESGSLDAEVKTRGVKKEVKCDYAQVKFKK